MVIRSYWLRGPAFITSADVQDTYVSTDKQTQVSSLMITLRSEASARLREVTRQEIGHRLGIMFDGAVQIAPLIQSAIPDGRVSLALGPGVSRAEAEGLAAGLRGELRHGP
jgi:preprotein translocase subunit SecD